MTVPTLSPAQARALDWLPGDGGVVLMPGEDRVVATPEEVELWNGMIALEAIGAVEITFPSSPLERFWVNASPAGLALRAAMLPKNEGDR